MLEFTGERVIPGLVDPNLLNEHLARYRFAARYAKGAAVLDAGCGSGYGTHELRDAASVTAMDLAHDALLHAAGAYGRDGVRFAQGSLEALPFADASFDLVVAFEVIEHLDRRDEMLREARRVLRPGGTLLVSTPNKSYYAESRGASGANPFHTHEYEYTEFRAALEAVFPHVRLWTQNRTEAIVFVPQEASAGVLDSAGDAATGEAHFYLAACSTAPVKHAEAFGWLPEAGNLLLERERHIGLLQAEVARRDAYIKELQVSQAELMRAQAAVNVELRKANNWAEEIAWELEQTGRRIAQVQDELDSVHEGYQERIRVMEQEAAERLAWVHDLQTQINVGNTEILRLRVEGEGLESLLGERTVWAQTLAEELDAARGKLERAQNQLHAAARSKWVRAGRLIHLGPAISPE